VSRKPTLLFVSPRFLLPVDSGGKIRTTQTLRGLKGGRFRIRLLSPGTPELVARHESQLQALCDEFDWWSQGPTGSTTRLSRARYLFSDLPIPVASDDLPQARRLVERHLDGGCDAVVFDFLHSAVLARSSIDVPSVLFTHNVEAEIFARHLERAGNALMRAIWHNQYRKMFEFERRSVNRFDVVVAVSERDGHKFAADYGLTKAFVIPTGVDLEYFSHVPPTRNRDLVFCGSMDWLANQEAVQQFLDVMWPIIIREVPDARMTVVGRAPPEKLVAAAARYGDAWRFTGFVEDVRPYVCGAAASVIPMRVAGGTRLKVYESMAMGPVVVSTRIGVEGLPVVSGTHCAIEDDAEAFAHATVALLKDDERRHAMSAAARQYVQDNFGYRVAARAFEQACMLAIERGEAGYRRDAPAQRSLRA
jgi:glycosyltransferase involved in cell wall biosynthesis